MSVRGGLLMAACLLLAGCSKPTVDEYFAQAESALGQARAAADTMRDRQQAGAQFAPAIEAYEKVVEEYPESARAAEAQFTIARIRQDETKEADLAVEAYKTYLSRWPEGEKAPLALFLIGYLYNNELHLLDSAAVAYRTFLEKYPDNEMAMSAQVELETLGKTPEEMLRERSAMEERALAPSGQGSRKRAQKGTATSL